MSRKNRKRRRRRKPSLLVYVDGLCEPRNPGGAACYGFVAYRHGERVAQGAGVACHGRQATNNVAEYSAAIAALQHLLDLGLEAERVEVRSDSQLLVRQMEGRYAVRSPRIAAEHRRLAGLSARFPAVYWRWIPRQANEEADSLSREAYRAHMEELAQRRAEGLQVVHQDPDGFLVQSSRGDHTYRVTLSPESCECPAFAKGYRPCKHISAARAATSQPIATQGGAAYAPPNGARR